MTKVCFQADADLDQRIVAAATRAEPGIDFRTATEAGLTGVPDSEVLALAAADQRVLVSHDQSTMPGHFAEFLATGHTSAGVLIAPQSLSLEVVVEELLLIWLASEPDEWIDRISFLPL